MKVLGEDCQYIATNSGDSAVAYSGNSILAQKCALEGLFMNDVIIGSESAHKIYNQREVGAGA